MSTTADLVTALKTELKAAGLTYSALAERLGMAESSVKRMFSASGDMPLSRIDAVCRALNLDFADLARSVAEKEPLLAELSLAQEKAVVGDRKLLLVAICCLSHWTAEQIVATYQMGEAEVVKHLTRLDRLGVIDLRLGNRYHLKVAKGFRWRPHGPVMQYFRNDVIDDYFAGGFDGESEMLMVVHGQIGRGLAHSFRERLARVGQDFAQQHIADQKLAPTDRRPYTLVIGMRSWLMAAFRDLKRPDVSWPEASSPNAPAR
ncbi:MAG TPA: helix-turn-helix transcriptional regulator [Aromatoleum sp.]|uniref:helix-turn-helix domain-containing protein n=1 Tax=Aromatoleum sp. TaxID=2307007 RepID=UPI002B495C9C|nr:helix-turn-helix transcriptional regulator [Aromatoleum sp.]HJV25524.1 helix-turn-helix transcriptional regulator [Aromatoleum sp.]